MKTKIYQADEIFSSEVLKDIHDTFKINGLVVFPTETVYGIGANALNAQAAEKIYQVKGRPQDNPLIVHISNLHQLPSLVKTISDDAKILIQAFWPGPLTLIFSKSDVIPNTITGGLETVAIRLPSNRIAKAVIEAANVPICAPSANLSGRPSSTLFHHVKQDLEGKVDIIIDGGKSTIGLESTVLDVSTETPTILRPGSITLGMIEAILKKPIIDASEAIYETPKSPGMKYTHYKPQGNIVLLDGELESVITYLNEHIKLYDVNEVGIICAHEISSKIHAKHIFDLGSINHPEEIASNLFIALRAMDDLKIKHIFTHTFSKNHIGSAIMNRLLKASGHNVIKI